ncbi:sugar-binding domain-containing protein [Christiangramia sp. SM2212]|uniref:Glycoside hydrolase family 2 TIM barrel-domain containing protein n=1 Tax=Christiangramia sediminicola TaxID=3073267 RepID=A0ABU1EKY3_9FLAO|nr:sugar-binding domain-containing protein [Christiangramia sp. SM2212]MDR5589038.1 glycoside hydrolase family 2 TIM barrel-domain containing protein [Christiangramia sp. SM2212]
MKFKTLFFFLGSILWMLSCNTSQEVENNNEKPEAILKTRWTDKVDPENVLAEYPRPIQKREKWMNLNGYWELETGKIDSIQFGQQLPEKILVPFAVESYLSGVMKKADHLLYRKEFSVPEDWNEQDIILNFEGVDYQTVAYLNGKKVGEHKGAFDHFSFNITPYLKEGKQELIVKVFDASNDGLQPVGKQVREPEGIFYTSTTGIWQTVWIEPLNENHIESFKIETDIDKKSISFQSEATAGDGRIKLVLKDGDNIVSEVEGNPGEKIEMQVPSPKLWSPENPFLYDLEVELISEDKVLDKFSSYVAMRKISLGKDENNNTRIMLNNEPYFQVGVLDQGYWPDGLMTPPTEEAYVWDIETFKKMGFNLLRKHAKTESQRWYYLCDKIGMLVWQDMPQVYPHEDFEDRLTDQDKAHFEKEMQAMIDDLYNYPSIVMWVVFNEGWGQYDTERLTRWVEDLDETRLVSNASGWTDHNVGDIIDMHSYPGPDIYPVEENRATVLGEFGGLGLTVPDHLWQEKNWGYREMTDTLEFKNSYKQLWDDVWQMKEDKAASAVVYTQLSDVEGEVNGLVTYDREIIKLPIEYLNDLHTDNMISPVSIDSDHSLFLDSEEVTLKNRKNEPIYYTIDGTEPTVESMKYSGPFQIENTSTLKARSITDNAKSAIVQKNFEKVSSFKSPQFNLSQNFDKGLKYSYYEGIWDSIPDFENMNAVKSGIATDIDLKESSRDSDFGLTFSGLIRIDQNGVYTFNLTSDDGSSLSINDEFKIDHDGHHSMETKTLDLALEKGYYKIALDYFQARGGLGLNLEIIGPDGKILPPGNYHQQ